MKENINLKSKNMQSKDLRIGNLVKNNETRYGDNILVIESIGDNDTVNVFFREYPMSALEPLMLTEKILIDFGFEKGDGIIIGEKEIPFYYLEDLEYNLQSGECCFGNFTVNLDKAHELQNLYFALYSEELEFKKRI